VQISRLSPAACRKLTRGVHAANVIHGDQTAAVLCLLRLLINLGLVGEWAAFYCITSTLTKARVYAFVMHTAQFALQFVAMTPILELVNVLTFHQA
jgi:hypothetical protein